MTKTCEYRQYLQQHITEDMLPNIMLIFDIKCLVAINQRSISLNTTKWMDTRIDLAHPLLWADLSKPKLKKSITNLSPACWILAHFCNFF